MASDTAFEEFTNILKNIWKCLRKKYQSTLCGLNLTTETFVPDESKQCGKAPSGSDMHTINMICNSSFIMFSTFFLIYVKEFTPTSYLLE